jgi:glycosidase
VRQFSTAGDFASVIKALPRIRALGVDILWLMPIHPIGEKHRKGHLGSPYAVKDYLKINAEFGDECDFQQLVDSIHALDMKVILDWVPNHSAWDNPLVSQHPEWYAKDHSGNFRPSPWWDWSDIIEFDYSHQGLRRFMIEAMCYWMSEFDIDGFRCDVAGYVPNDFWRQARQELDAIKPVFMLAEWESRDMHEHAFDMTYAWTWNEAMHGIAMRTLPLTKLRKYYSYNERSWPKQAYRMTFVSNHDKNAWEGTQREQFGDALEAAIILSVLGEGMPLIHNGQEAGESKRLAFFDKDCIEWQRDLVGDLYTQLIALKKHYDALHNGHYGGTMLPLQHSQIDRVFSFVRQGQNGDVLVALNLSEESVSVTFEDELTHADWHEVRLVGQTGTNTAGAFDCLSFAPWQPRVFVRS